MTKAPHVGVPSRLLQAPVDHGERVGDRLTANWDSRCLPSIDFRMLLSGSGQISMKIRFRSLLKPATLVWALVVVLLSLSATASAKSLDASLWRNRLLFVIAPDASDPDVVKKLAMLKRQTDRLVDRDILVFQIYLRGTSFFQDESLSVEDVTRLRRELGIKPDSRILLLIGKDGTVKRRAPIDTSVREILIQIDGMPMRRAEIEEKKSAGLPVTDP